VRLRFSRSGDARFLSHLEQIDVFRRLFRRADLPVAYSSGFSPQVKAAFGPAISVGYESSSEYVELELLKRVEPAEMIERLDKALPRGFKTLEAKKIPVFFPSIDSLLNVATYWIGTAAEEEKLKSFLSLPEIIVEKVKEGKTIRIDAKPLIRQLVNRDGGLYLEIRFGPKKNVKPEKLAQQLMGLTEEQTKLVQICRLGFLIEKKDGTISEP